MIDSRYERPTFSMDVVTFESDSTRPNLTLLTDLGRRYPGFPTPLSPTLSARESYPTPISESGSTVATPYVRSPNAHFVSPASLDGSNAYEASPSHMLSGYDDFAEQLGNIDTILARSNGTPKGRSSSLLPSTPPLTPGSPTSPQRIFSPRVDMLCYTARKQGVHVPPSAAAACTVPVGFSSVAHNTRCDSAVSVGSTRLQSIGASPRHIYQQEMSPIPTALPSIQIANGTEFETESPISPAGTILSYASNRAVDSGLLAVPALSEPQVAEYRFWVPCGRRVCGFGCGGVHEGEHAAAKRLFREAEDVTKHQAVGGGFAIGVNEDEDSDLKKVSLDVTQQEGRNEWSTASFTKPVDEWRRFLKNKERDVSVARV